jgi:undecaprenyl-diphosphatase
VAVSNSGTVIVDGAEPYWRAIGGKTLPLRFGAVLSPNTGRPEHRLSLAQAVFLGALHGPAELLPISSSGHVAVVPWLLGWSYDELDPELRKSLEVVLHAGTAAALLVTLRDEVDEALRGMNPHRLALIALSFVPPAIVGFVLERPIERHLGTPPTVATGLLAGSVAMALADRAPQTRSHGEAEIKDALWLGFAQACALVPGVSRNGATLAAARMRRFTREEANRLSRHVALPLIAGATALKMIRLRRRGLPPGARGAFAAGTAASFASTLGSTWLIRQVERDRSLMPYAVYRSALAALVFWRLSSGACTTMNA